LCPFSKRPFWSISRPALIESFDDFENLAFNEDFADKYSIYCLIELSEAVELSPEGQKLLELLKGEISLPERIVFERLWKVLKARDNNTLGKTGDILSYPKQFLNDSETYAATFITAALQLNSQKTSGELTRNLDKRSPHPYKSFATKS
jgi:hypothetical protein